MAWLPEVLGPARENHIVRSSSVVNSVVYGRGRVEYTTFDAPPPSVDVLRLAFCPRSVTADGKPLSLRGGLEQAGDCPSLRSTKTGLFPSGVLDAPGYTATALPCGDWLVSIRRDGAKSIALAGDDPQQAADDGTLSYAGDWQVVTDPGDWGGGSHVTESAGAAVVHRFQGNQVRLIGRAEASGGQADVFIDGVKQLVGIDCWTTGSAKRQQVLYYRSGLTQGEHEMKIVARGTKNPYATANRVWVDAVQSSAEAAEQDFGAGGGPRHAQRMIFGYPARKPFVDSAGRQWFPGTEFVVRSGHGTCSVGQAWWTQPASQPIAGTPDPELYRYGIHAPEFWVNATVGPGLYDVRLKFAERRALDDPLRRPVTVLTNGQQVSGELDVAQRAGGPHKALDMEFSRVETLHGVIEVRLVSPGGEAILQALEILPAR
jgi:hypothetical protein